MPQGRVPQPGFVLDVPRSDHWIDENTMSREDVWNQEAAETLSLLIRLVLPF
jgi:hypothetical protein